jgi:hypothetical protein
MNLIKQYIIQSISAASNNLRLSTQKIEVVALLREAINRSVNLENDIKEMKKITELSKFAIRLNEIYNYLTQPHVDFFKVSDKFKEHSQYLIKDLSSLLDNVSPASFKMALEKLHPSQKAADEIQIEETIDIDLSRRDTSTEAFETDIQPEESESTAREFKMPEDFEVLILEPVKPLDDFLRGLDPADTDKGKIEEFRDLIDSNAQLSKSQGFDILGAMHEIIAESLGLISAGKLTADKKTVDSIRACLIVIAAVVKDKKIDVTPFLERAEEFGQKIKNIN